MVDEKILDRLAKLLEMSKRGTENEAEVAAQRAAELMAKYQLEAADIEAHLSGGQQKPTIEAGRVDADGDAPRRIERWHSALLVAVAEAVGGQAWMTGGRYKQFMMIGPKDSVATAKYLYMCLERDVNRLSREAQRRHGEPSNAWRRAYALGMCAKISKRLKDGRKAAMSHATSTALVVVDATKAAIDEKIEAMNLRPQKRGNQKRPDAASWGYIDGDKVDLGSKERARLTEGQKKLGT